ncbi:hypothetical protein ACH4F6_31840 [Streptomyces sp. NPDC017936]|uniref:hypothetical protein n=1 Tax=Streptomyces sp. NPDC017936 TaxID=3365016 RepID=UPI0037A5ECB5
MTTDRGGDGDVDGHAGPTGDGLGGAATGASRVGACAKPPYGRTAGPAPSVVAPATSGTGTGKT